jgi:hypothetical protein
MIQQGQVFKLKAKGCGRQVFKLKAKGCGLVRVLLTQATTVSPAQSRAPCAA